MSLKRNKKNRNHCHVCGVFVCEDYQAGLRGDAEITEEARNHACDPAFLVRSERAREASEKRDYDEEKSREPTLGSRLSDGFAMLAESDDDYDEAAEARHHRGEESESRVRGRRSRYPE